MRACAVAVLPVKRFDDAKQRLDQALTARRARACSPRRWSPTCSTALRRAQRVDAVVVVTGEPGASRSPAPTTPRRSATTTAAIPTPRSRASPAALERDFGRALLVPGDCPALEPGELDELLSAAGPRPGRHDRRRPPRHRHQRAAAERPRRDLARASGRAAASATSAPPTPRARPGGSRSALARPRRRHRRRPPRPERGARRAHRRRRPHARRPAAARAAMTRLQAWAIPGLPEVRAGRRPGRAARGRGADARGRRRACRRPQGRVQGRGRAAPPRRRAPSRARERAGRGIGKDPRHVQVVLDESAEVVRAERGVLICRTHHGFVCANAGVDASNAPDEGTAITLPRDPDASARALRARLPAPPAVVIADSFGRAWRHGQCDVAVGIAGLRAARRLARAHRPLRPRAAGDVDRDRRRGRRRRGPRSRARTRASRPSSCAASSVTSASRTVPARRSLSARQAKTCSNSAP